MYLVDILKTDSCSIHIYIKQTGTGPDIFLSCLRKNLQVFVILNAREAVLTVYVFLTKLMFCSWKPLDL